MDDHRLGFLNVSLVDLKTKLRMMEASSSNLLDLLLARRGLMSARRNFEFTIKLFENGCLKVESLFYILSRVL